MASPRISRQEILFDQIGPLRPVKASKDDLERAWRSPMGDPAAPALWTRDHGTLRALKTRELRRMVRNADIARLWTRPGRQLNRAAPTSGSR